MIRPVRVVLSRHEMDAVLNLMRLSPDEFSDIENGADCPRGTLDLLEARILACVERRPS